ncbi:MAG: hypothetical protein NTV07_03290 [Candidatus Omnitrophica bacterium]|nr:hypothetical protein [Candidatus Omnitrophota bacterium]
MTKIIISSNRDNLEKFLQDENGAFFYVTVDAYFAEVEDFLAGEKYNNININEGADKIDFNKEYVDLIGRLNRDHYSMYWWSTTISHKGTFVSNLHRDIFNFYCLTNLIKKQDRNYIIISGSPAFNRCLKKYCEDNAFMCALLDEEKPFAWLADYRKSFLSDVYFIYRGWTRKLLARLHFSNVIKRSAGAKRSYYIMRSYVDKRSFIDGSLYKDVYFGALAEYLKQKGKDLIILVGIFADYRELTRKIKSSRQYAIIPQEYFVGYMDFIRVIISTFTHRIRIPGPVFFCGTEITDLLKESLKTDYKFNEIENNIIYFYYIKGLLKSITVGTFLFPLENQAWERLSILALRKYSPATEIVGYTHSSIIQSQLSYFLSKEEEKIVPLPDKIITAGEQPRLILSSNGNYVGRAKLVEGCALRFEHIFNKDKVLRTKNGKILVALSLDYGRCLNLLRFLLAALDQKNSPEVILRSHPYLPVESLIKKHNIKLSNNFHISKIRGFEQDLNDASLLIYADTTCCMEALMRGVPVICIDLKEAANSDPLFDVGSLKWTAYDKNGLHKILNEIDKMNDDEYVKKYNRANSYLVKYFYPIEEKYLARFIEGPS